MISWEKTLVDAYDACEKHIDYEHNSGSGLCPIAHQPLNVQIDIFIDDDANFRRAQRIEPETDERGKKRAVKIFAPADENACSRSSGIAPKGLSDDLRYICGDFRTHFPKSPKAKKSDDAHKAYMEQMQSWIEFGAPDDVGILYRYLQKNTTARDVIKCVSDAVPEDVARFTVIHRNDEIIKGMWQSREIAVSFADFCLSQKRESIDFITGEKRKLATIFPGQIRSGGDKAKLVSSNSMNKTDDFTFKGQYIKKPEDCVTVSFENAQKMTSALRYLISRQSIRNGSERIVCFQTQSGISLPDLTDDLFGESSGEEEAGNTAELYAERVKLAVNGIRKNLESRGNVTILGVDSAEGSDTDLKGRLAITRYCEKDQNTFFETVEKWYETCRWEFGTRILTPSPYRIACAVYGVQSGEKLEPKPARTKYIRKAVIDCTLEGKKLSPQIVTDVMKSVRHPQKYSLKTWRNDIICTALALLSRYYYDYKGEVLKMTLDKDRKDRSYQFGRLLAVMERIEETANYRNGTERTANTIKFFSSFAVKPMDTFARIHQKAVPYMKSFSPGTQNAYKNTIAEIIEKIERENGFTNEKLADTYLAGYYLQRKYMIEKAIEAKKEKEEAQHNA